MRNIDKEIICCIVDYDELAYICEKIILEPLKKKIKNKISVDITHKGVNKLKLITNTGI
mgnify:CR=1 FL=1